MLLRYYGRDHLGKLAGVMTTIMVASSALGPYFMGLSKEKLHSFEPTLQCFLAGTLGMVVASLFATPPARPTAGSQQPQDSD